MIIILNNLVTMDHFKDAHKIHEENYCFSHVLQVTSEY